MKWKSIILRELEMKKLLRRGFMRSGVRPTKNLSGRCDMCGAESSRLHPLRLGLCRNCTERSFAVAKGITKKKFIKRVFEDRACYFCGKRKFLGRWLWYFYFCICSDCVQRIGKKDVRDR